MDIEAAVERLAVGGYDGIPTHKNCITCAENMGAQVGRRACEKESLLNKRLNVRSQGAI